MIIDDLRDYFTFVTAFHRGNKKSLTSLQLMAKGTGKAAELARRFCYRANYTENTGT